MGRRLQVGAVAVLAVLVAMLTWLAVAAEPPASGRVPLKPTVDDAQPAALFIGDSFPAGSGAPSVDEAVSCLTAAALGWICNVDAQPGTGFIANGHANDSGYGRLIDRLPATKEKYLADIIVLDAGRNDRRYPDDQAKDAITTYLDALRDAWPDAQLVVIEPYFLDTQSPVLRPAVLEHLRAETARVRGQVINPYDAAWIPPGGGRRDLDAGDHRYIAERLVDTLRELGLDNVERTDPRSSS